MALGKRQRIIIRILGLTLGGLALLLLALPLWLPWILAPVAQKYGATYSRYQRQGYGWITLHGVTFTNEHVRVQAKRIDAPVPTLWLWRVRQSGASRPLVRVSDWQVTTLPSTGPSPQSSTYSNVHHVATIVPPLKHWFPLATLSNGTLIIQKAKLELPSATWSNGMLVAEVFAPQLKHRATVSADLGPRPHLRVRSDSLHVDSTIQLAWETERISLETKTLWDSNAITAQVEFGRAGVLPQRARVEAPQLEIPPHLVGLKEAPTIRGSISATWAERSFAIDLEATARSLKDTNTSPVLIKLHATGDTNAALVQSATLSAPWITAELSKELTVHYSGALLREPAYLKLEADLSKQSWAELKGILRGDAEFTPSTAKYPSARFQFAGSNVGNSNLTAKAFKLAGRFDWPELHDVQADAAFVDGSTLHADGRMNLEETSIHQASLQYNGPVIRQFLPPGFGCDGVAFSAKMHGPIKQLIHSGQVAITNLITPRLQPLQIEAAWEGEQFNLQHAQITAQAGVAALTMDGGLKLADMGLDAQLDKLTLSRSNSPVLELQQPCLIQTIIMHAHLGAALERFHWRGTAGEIEVVGKVDVPETGDFKISIKDLHSALFQDFFTGKIEPFHIHSLSGSGQWSNSPISFALQLSASTFAQQQIPLSAEASLRGDATGLVISNFVVSSQTSAVATAHGRLPISFNPTDPTNVLAVDLQKPLAFSLQTKPKALVWDKVAEWTGVVLAEPECNVNLEGTWAAPQGQIKVSAREAQFQRAKAEMPKFQNLKIVILLEKERARLTEGGFLVQQQPVTFQGEIPLGKTFWTTLKEKKIPNWKQARAQARIENAQVSAFTPLLPTILSPQGTLDLNLALIPGGNLQGELTLQKGRTHPLGNLGSVRDIETKMTFRERTLKLEKATAHIGGATVFLSGEFDLRGTEWLKKQVPPFQFSLKGTNVPLSRQPESIIRSDLDLSIVKTNGAPAVIIGTAQLRDSFYLRDLQDLIPSKVASAAKRPPYFSIEAPTVADWRLGVRVTGNRFLRVRSTIFNGDVSANLKLDGTLKDPIALGDIRIDSGAVRFPFASLEVQQGMVTLNSEDPYRPHLLVEAGSKKFGYDVRMEASGPVDAPILQFSSTPPLSSEQIVLMLTAGELPKGNYSLTPQQKAQTVAVFFGRDLLSRFGFGDEGEDRLTIHSGEQISEQGRPTYSLEYKLTDRWSLVGEYDRFNAFNAGLKWRVYSR